MKVSHRFVLLVIVAVLAADQVTKYLAVSRLTDALDGREGLARVTGFVTEQNLDNRPPPEDGSYRVLRPYRFIEDYWHFRYVENPGAAWGIFGDMPEGVRRLFFLVVSLAAMGFIFVMYRRTPMEQRLARVALALVTGGALGNFVDRLLRGYVIDFIDWHWRNQPGMRWPTFNVADVAISVGVGLMLLDSLRAPKSPNP
ncbi:signal peptidase II [Myxococcus xanthus DK 1622]|uniref:Lipoprotein signal peptidase n=1 Tax=Myxococcus xanthus (strain DK1622) TaxID=246197 RepID=Q1DFD1_MYXXD|nr:MULTISPECIES: signal peptidase II [Myxococcus]ABF86672.1 signal peptidase II [Myxococcus xanthus DK 1622]NOJ53081.1 signal peptidase II [Myxococcus xanthus]QPM80086.1 signal peptidase II [Myxococcus xanthus]QVW69150.1 signal peptidase II [Myxococcus xanthus DZ2]QZZ47923.1 Lipoprotein signal peptidase [Myxococcus xanthus]